MTRNVDQLRSIQTFEELIPFLEDDLDWPFPHGSQEYEFDDLTFEYTPDELGLEDEYAAKIKRIHQLRPLVSGQPWGIFFVQFENKKLPIVVLRRILSHLVLKQRKSANPADRARWNAGDLLFISAFAEEGTLQREIAFAHFHQDPGDQPTLRVLGWDGGDTPLKLEHVSQILKHRLSWPTNPADHAAWRKQWAGAFRYSIGQQIQTADMLARELARVARNIRDAAMKLMKVESSRGPLRRMHEAFRIALIHDLTPEGFADTYAQTITYGLLTAAISRTDMSAGADGTHVLAEDIHNMVPITNPFLKEMLESFLKVGGRSTSQQPGLDFDELGVQEVVEMLRSSEIDLPAVLEDFGNKNPGEDPVIRFYEDFLRAYNKELKIKRGVFYTPQPVVSYIVRSVHVQLQKEFGLPDGLASTITWREMAAKMAVEGRALTIPVGTLPDSPFVVILDPATGTATFLVEVIDLIFRTLTERWKTEKLTPVQREAAWKRYVPMHLLPRMFGYELMMAPYAIAHMKIGLKLGETGYRFGEIEERVRIYLTNALEPPREEKEQRVFAEWAPALAHEAKAVGEVKMRTRYTVVLGNPPYSGISANMSEAAQELVERYRFVNGEPLGERKVWLQNDYVKFLGFAHKLLSATGVGCLGLITDSSYLDGPTFRGVRSNLLSDFEDLSLLNLNGSTKKKGKAESQADQNVFDITQSVAVIIASRSHSTEHHFSTAALLGSRTSKYEALMNSHSSQIEATNVSPIAPFFSFVPSSDEHGTEYRAFFSVLDAFPFHSVGIQTSRDHLAIDFTKEELLLKIKDFISTSKTDQHIRDQFFPGKKVKDYLAGDTRGWSLAYARKELRKLENLQDYIVPINYRPFDTRFIFQSPLLVDWPRQDISDQMKSGRNLGLCVLRRTENDRPFDYFGVSRDAISNHQISLKDGTYLLPLFVEEAVGSSLFISKTEKKVNFSSDFSSAFSRCSTNSSANSHRQVEAFAVDVFHYVYAVFHSPNYRARYLDFLRNDAARLPVPRTNELFSQLAKCGAKLVGLHLLSSQPPENARARYVGRKGIAIGKIVYSKETVFINSDLEDGFTNVPLSVWTFSMGGYPVCEKWLKDCKDRALSSEDIRCYGDIVAAISETLHVMPEIDSLIDRHGGWPNAFS